MLLKRYTQFLLFLIVVIISILVHPLKIQAAVICSEWDDAINNNWELHEHYRIKRDDIGIFFNFEWDKKKKIIKIKRNEENYPIVRFSLFEKKNITQGSIIKSFNDVNLAKINDLELEKMSKLSSVAKLILINDKTIIIEPKSYKLNDIKMNTFGLKTIHSVGSIKGITEISFNSSFSNERPDLLNIIKKEKLLDYTWSTLCDNTIDRNYFPITDFIFGEFRYDEDVRLGLNNKTKVNIPIMSVTIDNDVARVIRQESGVSFFRQDFEFHKFPFDKQKIIFNIFTNKRSTGNPELDFEQEGPVVTLITPGIEAFLNLERFMNETNYLKEWEVVNTDIKSFEKVIENVHDLYLGKTITDNENMLQIEIDVERNYEQYIFKIIIPVFLILSLAWFVLWIPTKEFETRLTTSMVALLSLIAYNFVFADDVPKLNYLTSLDEYILLSYIFCCIPTFMSIWFSRFISTNQKKATLINRKIRVWGIVFYIISSCWIFFPKNNIII